MKEVFGSTLSQMLIMAFCIIIGFVLRKTKVLPENSASVMSKLENYVFCPALTISTFMTYCTIESLKTQYILIIFSAVAVFLGVAVATPLSRLFVKEGYERNIYKYALTFANCGFMGNAIVPGILGQEYLYPYLMFTLPLNIVIYTWGIDLLVPKGEEKESVFKRIMKPPLISCLIGIVLGLSSAKTVMPDLVISALDGLKACMAPVAMVLTGFVIGSYNIKSILLDKKVYIASALRLVLLPALFVAVLLGLSKLIGIERETYVLALTMVLFAFATPLGLNTVVFPSAYGGDPKTGASMALISTTLCIVTIPIMYALFTAVL